MLYQFRLIFSPDSLSLQGFPLLSRLQDVEWAGNVKHIVVSYGLRIYEGSITRMHPAPRCST